MTDAKIATLLQETEATKKTMEVNIRKAIANLKRLEALEEKTFDLGQESRKFAIQSQEVQLAAKAKSYMLTGAAVLGLAGLVCGLVTHLTSPVVCIWFTLLGASVGAGIGKNFSFISAFFERKRFAYQLDNREAPKAPARPPVLLEKPLPTLVYAFQLKKNDATVPEEEASQKSRQTLKRK